MNHLYNQFKTQYLPLTLIAIATCALFLPVMPSVQIPDGDSMIIIYIGQQILDGQIFFRDMWNNKTPGVFYLNALALWLSGGSLWGIWIVEVIWTFLAVCIGFFLFKRVFGIVPAIAGIFWGLSSLVMVKQGGNYVETFAPLFQYALFYLFYRSSQKKFPFYYDLLIGIVAAGLFLFKQTLVGIPLAIGIYWLLSINQHSWRKNLSRIGWAFLGGSTTLLLVVWYFIANDAWAELWNQLFVGYS